MGRRERTSVTAVGRAAAHRWVARTAALVVPVLLAVSVLMGCQRQTRGHAATSSPDTARAVALLREALAIGETSRETSEREAIMREVICTWAAVDPKEALRRARALPKGEQQAALRAAADVLVVTNTARGIELAREIGYQFQDTDKISATAAALARISPDDAVRFTFSQEEEQAAIAERATAETLVARDPNAAIALAQSQSDPQQPWKRQLFLASVVEAIARTDSAQALTFVEGISEKDGHDGAFRDVVSIIARDDPEKALTLVGRIRDPGIAKWVRCDIAQGFARRDPARALQMARSMEGPQRSQALAGISRELAASDPDAALRVVLEMGPEWFGDDAAYFLAKSVWERNPKNASEIAQRIADEFSEYLPAFHLAVKTVARTDPEAALKIIATAPEWADNVRQAVAEVLGRDHPEQAKGVAQQIATEWMRSEAFADIAIARAQANPANGIRLAEAITDKDDREAALAGIACDLADKDFETALSASRKITDDSLRASMMCKLALTVAGKTLPSRDEVP